ncbi:hypothetical protein [Porcipelethomonas sp.]|uniref:hypothetical protein n=1 Tax=Porcipelethomonas sp. TaxID=2981675 RepID=UPI003EF66D10
MAVDGVSPRALKSGISESTPNNMTFGAGVLVKDLSWDSTRKVLTTDTVPQSGKTYYYWYQAKWEALDGDEFSPLYTYYEQVPGWNYNSCKKMGTTKDGSKLSIVPEYSDIEVDGVLVKMKGMTVKTGEKATLETTLVENTAENAAMAIGGTISAKSNLVSDINFSNSSCKVVKSRSSVAVSDYITNLALIANRIDDNSNAPMIVIFKNALCTSGFEIETKNKEISAFKTTFECYADLSSDVSASLPYEIIYLESESA